MGQAARRHCSGHRTTRSLTASRTCAEVRTSELTDESAGGFRRRRRNEVEVTCRVSSTARIVVTTAFRGCHDSTSLCHPSRWCTDAVADHGNRESQLRTDRGCETTPLPCRRALVAPGRGGLRFATRAIGSYSLLRLWQDFRVAVRLLGRHSLHAGCGPHFVLGITGPGPTVGLTPSTTGVVDTGGGDVPMITMKPTHRLALDASGLLNIVTTDDGQQQRAWHDEHGVQEWA
jgi:hypothetical protein